MPIFALCHIGNMVMDHFSRNLFSVDDKLPHSVVVVVVVWTEVLLRRTDANIEYILSTACSTSAPRAEPTLNQAPRDELNATVSIANEQSKHDGYWRRYWRDSIATRANEQMSQTHLVAHFGPWSSGAVDHAPTGIRNRIANCPNGLASAGSHCCCSFIHEQGKTQEPIAVGAARASLRLDMYTYVYIYIYVRINISINWSDLAWATLWHGPESIYRQAVCSCASWPKEAFCLRLLYPVSCICPPSGRR